MWTSIANLKENLNKIALDVHDNDDDDDDDEELTIHGVNGGNIDRRRSHSLAHSNLSFNSNGFDSPYSSEIEQYKAEIKKLRDSEAEIKALSVNYAALLKEKEDHIARLHQENGSLKQNLEVTSAALSASRNDASRTSTSGLNASRESREHSPSQQNKHGSTGRTRSSGNQWQNGVVSKHDGTSNGYLHTSPADSPSRNSNSGREKELADLLEEKNRHLAAIQNDHELQMKKLRVELEKAGEALTNTKLKLQDEQKISGSLAEELNALKSGHNNTSSEVNKLRQEVHEKESKIKQLQTELLRKHNDGVNDSDSLRRKMASLEKENVELKVEKEKLESALKESVRTGKKPDSLDESGQTSANFPGKVELERSLQQTEKDLKETRRERDKAKQELARLKQHLLDKEMEESEKMDEDSKVIEELRQHVEYQKATISNLERALGQARASQEEIKTMNDYELQKSKEVIEDLKKKLASFISAIDAKNAELLNLQTALGQYYAESEAKVRLEGELSQSREECSRFSQLLEESKQQVEASNKEKDDLVAKLVQADKMVTEWKNRVNKLEEDNTKLRRALEQSMTRLNRMSVDSDFLVDRRIVIKLLVTYFQRNHSKEVLDLMVRMLGFTDEDKQRIGVAQQGTGKGVVRGVLGLPGRLVGGIIGGASPGTPTNMASDNQSFADLWVDFLLKESEEREKREAMETTDRAQGATSVGSPGPSVAQSQLSDRRSNTSGRPPLFTTTNPSIDTSRSSYPYQSSRPYDNPASEFSTVPLTPSGKQFS